MKLYDSGEFRATEDWPYAISAGTVVYRQVGEATEVLLLRRLQATDPGSAGTNAESYHLPKGHVELGESLEQAALRETREEAGCEVRLQGYLGTRYWAAITSPKNGISVEKTVHYFAGLWQADLISMDDEHDGKVWVSIDEAEKLLGKPNPKEEDEIIRRLKTFLKLAA